MGTSPSPLHSSLDVMVDWMNRSEPAAVLLFALMGSFPGGVFAADLDAMWHDHMCFNPRCSLSPAFVAHQTQHVLASPLSCVSRHPSQTSVRSASASVAPVPASSPTSFTADETHEFGTAPGVGVEPEPASASAMDGASGPSARGAMAASQGLGTPASAVVDASAGQPQVGVLDGAQVSLGGGFSVHSIASLPVPASALPDTSTSLSATNHMASPPDAALATPPASTASMPVAVHATVAGHAVVPHAATNGAATATPHPGVSSSPSSDTKLHAAMMMDPASPSSPPPSAICVPSRPRRPSQLPPLRTVSGAQSVLTESPASHVPLHHRRTTSLPTCRGCGRCACGPWRRLMDSLIQASLVQRLELRRPVPVPTAPRDAQLGSGGRGAGVGGGGGGGDDVSNAHEVFLTYPCIASYADGLLSSQLRHLFATRVCVRLGNLCYVLHDWLRGDRHVEARDLLARHEPNIWAALRNFPHTHHAVSAPVCRNNSHVSTSTETGAGAACSGAPAAAAAAVAATSTVGTETVATNAPARAMMGPTAMSLPRVRSRSLDSSTSSFCDESGGVSVLPTMPLTAVGTMASFFPHLLLHVGRAQDAVVAADVGLMSCRALLDSTGEANVLCAKAHALLQVDDCRALECCGQAIELYQCMNSNAGLASAKEMLGRLKIQFSQELPSALRDLEDARQLYSALPSREMALFGEATCLKSIAEYQAWVRNREDWVAFANSYFEMALGKIRQLKDQDCVTEANILIAWAMFKLKHLDNAFGCGQDLQSAYALCQRVGYRMGEANVWRSLGDMHYKCGAMGDARKHYSLALQLYKELQDDQNQSLMALNIQDLDELPVVSGKKERRRARRTAAGNIPGSGATAGVGAAAAGAVAGTAGGVAAGRTSNGARPSAPSAMTGSGSGLGGLLSHVGGGMLHYQDETGRRTDSDTSSTSSSTSSTTSADSDAAVARMLDQAAAAESASMSHVGVGHGGGFGSHVDIHSDGGGGDIRNGLDTLPELTYHGAATADEDLDFQNWARMTASGEPVPPTPVTSRVLRASIGHGSVLPHGHSQQVGRSSDDSNANTEAGGANSARRTLFFEGSDTQLNPRYTTPSPTQRVTADAELSLLQSTGR